MSKNLKKEEQEENNEDYFFLLKNKSNHFKIDQALINEQTKK